MENIRRVSRSVWKVSVDSNVYFIDGPEKIIIDAGPRSYRNILSSFLEKIVDLRKIQRVFFTHLHYDHIGNFDLFPNASFHASREEIARWRKNPYEAVLDEFMAEKSKEIDLREFPDLDWLEVIHTPGHTSGSVCFWLPSEKVLFTGDTIFRNGTGRTDLPTSVPEEMQKSVVKLVAYNFSVLCPGHDY